MIIFARNIFSIFKQFILEGHSLLVSIVSHQSDHRSDKIIKSNLDVEELIRTLE